MHQLPGRRVLGRCRREQCECVCFVSDRVVFKHCWGECVHYMPDLDLVRHWIHFHHKLCLQRGVLRPERWHVHGVPDEFVFRGRIYIHHKLLVQRRFLRTERWRVYVLSVYLHIFTR